MVNINIRIPDELHKRTRLAAALADKTLKEYIIERLEQRVANERVTKGVTLK